VHASAHSQAAASPRRYLTKAGLRMRYQRAEDPGKRAVVASG
jgi:hypothetical protein